MAYLGWESDMHNKADLVQIQLCWDHYPVIFLPNHDGETARTDRDNDCDQCLDRRIGQLYKSHRPARGL